MAVRTPLGVALLIALTLAGCAGPDATEVTTAEVVAAEVTETVAAPGVVSAAQTQDVRSEVAGVLAEIAVREGETVAAGDVVARLDSAALDEVLDEAERALAALEEAPEVQAGAALSIDPLPPVANPAEDAVAALDADVRPQLEAAREAVESAPGLPDEVAAALPEDAEDPVAAAAAQATAALDALETTYEGIRQALLSAGASATAQQRALSEQVTASAAEAQRALDDAVAQVARQATDAQRAQLDATRAQAEAQREALVLEAPINGVVELRAGPDAAAQFGGLGLEGALGGLGLPDSDDRGLAQGEADAGGLDAGRPVEGAAVVPGQALLRVHDLSDWYIDADVDEIDAPAVAEGQPAVVRIDAFPDAEFEGVVESVALSAQRGLTGGVAYRTRVRIIDPPEDPGPRLGMTASVEIDTRTVAADLAIPARAVVRREVGTAVFAVRDGQAALVPVELLAQGGELAAVRGEIGVGERVVVEGYEGLADGDRVREG